MISVIRNNFMRNGVFFMPVFIIALDLNAQAVDLYMYQVDPLKKVLKEQTYFRDELDTIRVARGETASIQIVLKGSKDICDMKAFIKEIRSEHASLDGATCGWVGYPIIHRLTTSFVRSAVISLTQSCRTPRFLLNRESHSHSG